jgi:hypothetical protein
MVNLLRASDGGLGPAYWLMTTIAIVGVIFIGIWMRFCFQVAPWALQLWVDENGYRMYGQEQRLFFKGPYSWVWDGLRIVYRIRVRDRGGILRMGWVRIGFHWRPSSDRIDSCWDVRRPEPRANRTDNAVGSPLMWDRELDGP